jgi:polyisoprenoid-binding protein YceI
LAPWKQRGNRREAATTFNPQTGTAEGEFLLAVRTGDSGNSTRDRKMQDEALESKKYPEATFHPAKVAGTISSGTTQNATVECTFNIHGADHPLTLQFSVQVNGADATAMTRFIVPYVDWGMKDESRRLLKVDKEVTVDVVARDN